MSLKTDYFYIHSWGFLFSLSFANKNYVVISKGYLTKENSRRMECEVFMDGIGLCAEDSKVALEIPLVSEIYQDCFFTFEESMEKK